MRKSKHRFSTLLWFACIAAALCVLLCFQFVVTSGSSMMPTYNSGDLLLKIIPYREAKVGDVVVIEHQGKLMVKRVAAVAGQKAIAPDIQFSSTNVVSATSVHYEQLDAEDYLRGFDLWGDYTYWNQYDYWNRDTSYTVPEGYIFVVGDNLSNSYDSRNPDFGLISTDQIKGYILLRILGG